MYHLILSFSLLTSILFSGCTHQNQDCTQFLSTALQEYSQKRIQDMRYEMQLQKMYLNANTPIYDPDGKRFELGRLFTQGNILFFRYSNLSCNSCNKPILNALYAFRKNNPAFRVILLASYDNLRAFTSFQRANYDKIEMYYLHPKDSKGTFAPEIPPYLFVVGSDLEIQAPFIAPKEMVGAIEAYLETIQDML